METVYTNQRFASKKAIKDAIAAGKSVGCHTEGLGPSTIPDGVHVLVGPSAYERKFYGQVRVVNGWIEKVVK
jgi:hypothetical protein